MTSSSLSLLPHYQAPSSWWEHVPVAHWLIEKLQPRIVVELGSHYGVSFFSFCEAASRFSPETFIYAVDTWEGDEHAGSYDERVYLKVSAHQQAHYKQRSRMVRSTFDEAAEHFADTSIDILHIDGLHTYAAVSNDFNTWLPKLRGGGSILFHDWNVRESDFGVWRLWQDIKDDGRFQCFEIPNGHGLGIATFTDLEPEWHSELAMLLPALTCKGALLDQVSILNSQKDGLVAEITEIKRHVANLEEQSRERQAHIESLLNRASDLETALVKARKGLTARVLNRLSRLGR
jgi:predicted O-methyltransferase YrrM